VENPEVFYVTANEYRGLAEDGETVAVTQLKTTVPALVSPLSSDEVTSLLLDAMVEIDAFIGGGWEPLEDGQEFTFPRCQDTDDDGAAVIPRAVALATRMVADAIISKRKRGVLPHEIASESKLGHSYSKHTRGSAPDFGFEHWPPEAMAILDRAGFYRKIGGMLATDDPSLADC
jgi:hypothetical protein